MTREECLANIARRDGAVQAVWHLDAAARAGQGALAGVPVLVKDNVAVAGMPWTAGLAAFAARIAEVDAPCVAGLRAAGAIILGKVALHEGALGATTSAPRRCDNPLAPGFTPGGSSGGSGAAVAAGFAALAIGTDTMGSVRIPAAYCGVVGFKPTAGLVGRSLVTPLSLTLDTVGMIARTVREAAAGLAAMVVPDADDAGWVPHRADGRRCPRHRPLRDDHARLAGPGMARPDGGWRARGSPRPRSRASAHRRSLERHRDAGLGAGARASRRAFS